MDSEANMKTLVSHWPRLSWVKHVEKALVAVGHFEFNFEGHAGYFGISFDVSGAKCGLALLLVGKNS